MTEENPYLTMPADTFKTHISQIVEAMETQKMTTLQAFGETLSEDTVNKVAEHATLTSQVKTLEDAAATAVAKELSPGTLKLAKMSTDRVISDIRAVDENYPITKIIDSSLTEFEKIDMLDGALQGAKYTQKAVDAIKEELGAGSTTMKQGFSSPNEASDADSIAEKLIAASGVEV